MQDEGLKPSDINQCLHEPVQRHLPAQVANGLVDFAFIPTYTTKSDQFIPESLRDELAIVWSGPLSRNDYLIGVSDPMDPKKQSKLIKVQQAFLELDRTSNDGRAVLDAYALPGFEMPTKEFPERTNQQIKTYFRSQKDCQLATHHDASPPGRTGPWEITILVHCPTLVRHQPSAHPLAGLRQFSRHNAVTPSFFS